MRLEKRQNAPPEIYVGSMADVSFLLVIFFIVTSVLVAARGLDLTFEAPPVDNGTVDPEESVDVHVQADGRLLVDGRAVALDELLAYIAPKIDQDPEKPVIVRTEPDARYFSMIAVLDELRSAPEKAGFEVANLVIPTQREMGGDWISAGWTDG